MSKITAHSSPASPAAALTPAAGGPHVAAQADQARVAALFAQVAHPIAGAGHAAGGGQQRERGEGDQREPSKQNGEWEIPTNGRNLRMTERGAE